MTRGADGGGGERSVEARMRRLEDLEAIRRLRMDYHRHVNSRTMPQAAMLYTEDALVDFGPTERAHGREEIEALYEKYNGQLDIIKQFAANHMIELNGDEAHAEAYADARYGYDGHSVMACASYDERYRRTAEGWKISEMVVKIHFAVPVQQGWAGGGPNYAAWDRTTPIPEIEA